MTSKKSTALALNSDQLIKQIKKEVQNEFLTSNQEVYKAGLRSLIIQEQKLEKQIAQIKSEIKHLHEAREALDDAFKTGALHSVTDARGVVRKVSAKIALSEIDADFS
jgi:uncharacterized protein (UPF0335 family)